jgi:hypothetical protein
MALSVARSRQIERGLIREAIATRSIERRLGDELITASRDVIAAWHRFPILHPRLRALRLALARLEELVGKP